MSTRNAWCVLVRGISLRRVRAWLARGAVWVIVWAIEQHRGSSLQRLAGHARVSSHQQHVQPVLFLTATTNILYGACVRVCERGGRMDGMHGSLDR